MKSIKIGKGLEAYVDDEDYNSLSKYSWFASKSSRNHYAKRINKDNKSIQMHHQVLNITVPKGMVVDHINNNTLDNRRNNLRLITLRQNQMNKSVSVNSTSKYKGVYWEKAKKKWRAKIKLKTKIKHLGYFTDEKEAAAAYDKAAKRYFKEYANLNFKTK